MAHVVSQQTNMVVPEVMAQALEKKMIDSIKLSPLAIINTDLTGNGGDTITVPYFNYIGDATDLAENTAGEADLLSAGTATATIKKAFKGVEITDEALLTSFTSPMAEIERQLAMAMASKVETDCYTVMEASTNTVDLSETNTVEISSAGIATAVVDRFGENFEDVYMLITPKQYNKLRLEDKFIQVANGQAVMSGHVGEVYGVGLIVSSRVNGAKNIMLKKGGLQIAVKRGVNVETDRDILKKTTVVTVDRHYVAHILDGSKVATVVFKETV